jgi:hypothetical protein
VPINKYATIHWTSFTRAYLPPITDQVIQERARDLNMSVEDARAAIERIYAEEDIWCNSLYQVNIRTIPSNGLVPEVKHLSIKRRDKRVVHDWRDLQRIKNELVGAECEAVEIYPAESRLVDSANQYHLWVFNDPSYRIGLGFQERFVRNNQTPGGATKQRSR